MRGEVLDMLIGYMPVSTGEQNLDLQRDAFERTGCERVYNDVCSGRATELRIPTQSGHLFQLDPGHRSDFNPATTIIPPL